MSAATYHIKENGDPGVCRASHGNCPRGGEDKHFTSKEAARDYYEKHADKFPQTIKKTPTPRLTPAQKRLAKAQELYDQTEKELKEITKAKNRVAREFRKAEDHIRENILDPTKSADPAWVQTYEKAKVQSEVIDKMVKEKQAEFDKARRALTNAKEAAAPKPKTPARSTPAPAATYYSYGRCGGFQGC